MKRKFICLIIACFYLSYHTNAQIPYPGTNPGKAEANASKTRFELHNSVLKITFINNNSKLSIAGFEDKAAKDNLQLDAPLFELLLPANKVLTSNNFTLVGTPQKGNIQADQSASSYASKLGGVKYSADLQNSKSGIKVHWEATLTDNANYVRQIVTLRANDSVKVEEIRLLKLPVSVGIKRIGTVDGSPLQHHNMFFALEHPMSQVKNERLFTTAYLPRLSPLKHDEPVTASSVCGVVPEHQLRRGFLYYIERERANPYHQMLHYNSWFDISWGDRKLNETNCLNRIKTFGDSLISARHVPLKAFLFDDGWDDNQTLWKFNSDFPDGFSKLKTTASTYHAGLGVWISPWGGYDQAKEQRLAYGRKQSPPFETNNNGFTLAGPVYFNRFKSVTTDFIKDYNISMFKFDGVGAGNGASGASITYQKDIEALLRLITELRQQKPDIYFSLTVGTWPSVYWLKYGDAIWRAGGDTGLEGTGAKRQRWITYRDAQAYKNIVKRAPLYPLNSLMYHGICIADNGLPGELEMDNKNISDEIWSFFGTGTSLQELYINPHKLNSQNWDSLSQAANWSEKHKEILSDVHWVGGDPAKGDVYGFAAWRNQEGVLTLRNPSATEKTFLVNVRQVFEIPNSLTDNYNFYDAKTAAKAKSYAGKFVTVKLMPYEVKVLNASDAK